MPKLLRLGLELVTVCLLAGASSACTAPEDDDAVATSEQRSAVRTTTSLRDGLLVLRTSIPASCAACTDEDGDGLADDWEDALLERLRPRMALHRDEPLVGDPDGRFGYVARVFRPADAAPDIVRAIIVTGFSLDPGVRILGRSVSAHDGDSERIAVELALSAGGREATVVRAYFAAHEHTMNDHSRVYGTSELRAAATFGDDARGEPRWVVFPSLAKHPVFPNPAACAATSLKGTGLFRERCAASEAESHRVLPAIVNAGEPSGHRATDLASIGFPGDDAWADQRFCGGFRDAPRLGGGCAESIAEKLEDDPFDGRGQTPPPGEAIPSP